MAKYATIPDADLSSAGDDFHILWAIKKSLDLLNFDENGLKALGIEGVEKSLSNKIDPHGEKLLGIDLIEYHGGENFSEANKVVISQLKYSTRRTSENWTLYQLYKGKKNKSHKGSIIHRLASIYKTLLTEFGRDLVLQKVKIKLISNRDINPTQIKTVLDVQKKLSLTSKNKLSFNKILKNLPKYRNGFENLFKASELNTTEFSDFLALLDFDDCGASSRDLLEKELIMAISNTSVSSRHQFDSFARLIWKKMMPESKSNTRITLIDVIANLGFNNGSLENIFPVPQRFEILKKSIKREQLDDIISTIESSKGIPVCLHGGAGIGKSTIVQQIKEHIPDYCECVIYDCYGNGSYLDSSDRRHLHRNALVQVTNEIAKKTGVDFLISKNESDETYIKEFKRRLNDALNILKQRNKNAYLVIIIDAADNNVTAAKKREENSFVHDMLEETFPVECNLVVTCRTHRKNTLKLPHKYCDIQISPFTNDETEIHLKYFIPDSTDEEVSDFHKLTKGIPRVQTYSIGLKQEGISEIINYLRPNGKVVEDIIEERINEAIKKIGSNGRELIDTFFVNLITLPRPVPVSYISRLLNEPVELFNDLASDIWHGLVLDNDKFSFRDEDFENYVRGAYIVDDSDLNKIAKLFIEKSDEDEYASINLGNILFEAGLKEDLKNIVLEEKFRSLPIDPVRNKETYIGRTKLALKVADSDTDNITFFKLLFIAAEESKNDKALTNLLINNPDLVIQFGDDSSLLKLSNNSEGKTWGGSFHLKLAGIYSRIPSKKEISKNHLQTAHKWLNWKYNSLNEDERNEYPISLQDIAFETESILRNFGTRKAFVSLCRWIPKSIHVSSGDLFLENTIFNSKEKEIKEWTNNLELPFLAKIFLINKLFKFNRSIGHFDFVLIVDFLKKVLNKKIDFENSFYATIVDFCEILTAATDVSQEEVSEILDSITYKIPSRVPHFSTTYDHHKDSQLEFEISLKLEALKSSLSKKAILLEDLYPIKFKDIDKIKDYEKRRSLENDKNDFTGFFKHAIPIFQLKADKLTGRLNTKECVSKFSQICTNIKDDWKFRHYSHWANDRLNYLAGSLLEFVLLLNKNEGYIEQIINSFLNDKSNQIRLRLIVLEKILHQSILHKLSLKILDELDQIISDKTMSATEATDLFLECSVIASKIDATVGKYYFDKAIEAVSDVDYEAFYQIRCLYGLTENGILSRNSKLAYDFARYIEYADEKLGYYDKKHFPYSEGIKGIFNLDPSSAFSTVSRWHHRNVIELNRYIIPIINTSLKNGIISHNIAGALLPLNTHYYHDEIIEIYKKVISQYKLNTDNKNLTYFTKTIFRNLKLDKNLALIEALYNEVKDSNKLFPNLVQEIEEYKDFRNDLKNEKKSEYENKYKEEDYKHPIDLAKIDLLSTQDLEKAIMEINQAGNDYGTRLIVENFLAEVKENCTPKNYVKHLDALINISSELLNLYAFENALKRCLNEWSIHPSVRKWKKERFKYILSKWFSEFNKDDYLLLSHINSFAKLFSLKDSDLAVAMRNLLPEKIENLSDESIYGSFSLMNKTLDKTENEKTITWVLNRWTAKIDRKIADGEWNEDLSPPASSDLAVSGILRFVLGNPDKRLRWRAVHAIRRLINVGEVGILDNLLSAQNKTTCYPFQNKEYTYYWMSAKLYLWIAIERVSSENPKVLIHLKDCFYKELMNDELPHTLIQFFIKKTCLQLYEFDDSIYSSMEVKNINNTLSSRLPRISEEKSGKHKRKAKSSSEKEWKFDFDIMDTLPYSFNRLGEFFNISEYEVADFCDNIITNIWGYKGNVNNDDYVRNQTDQRDYPLLSKRHSNQPTIEDLQTYYEYHAMFCAATELLSKYSLIESDWNWENWESWLPSKANTWDNYWLSDSRDPLPLEKKYWHIEYSKFDKEWRDNIDEEKYDYEVGFNHYFGKDQISAFSGGTRHFGENYESVSIRSALVTSRGSDALLRAFQSATDSHDYRIPFEEDEDRFEINECGFEYFGWLSNPRSEVDGLDNHDPLASDIVKDYITFGKIVRDSFDITLQESYKKTFLKNKLIAEYQHWSEITEYKHHGQVESDGVLFRVDIHFLLEFLTKVDKCMIIKCEIDRQLKERIYGRDRWELKLKNNVKIYLIKPNGIVKTLGGRDFKIRKKANPRTEA